MTSTVSINTQKITVSETEEITIGDAVEVGGVWKRAIRVFGTTDGPEGVPVLEIVVTSDAKDKIAIPVPEIGF